MAEPLSLEVIQSEFSEESEAWVLRDVKSGKYLIIPHPNYLNRKPIHFFFNKEAAQDVLTEVLDVNDKMRNEDVFPVQVKLLQTLREIALGKTNGDGFVVHPPIEVYEFLESKKVLNDEEFDEFIT